MRLSKGLVRRLQSNKQQEWRRKHIKKQGGKCYYCKHPFDERNFNRAATLDHKIPLSKDGPDHWENTCAACCGCNKLKGNMTEQEFMEKYSNLKYGTGDINVVESAW